MEGSNKKKKKRSSLGPFTDVFRLEVSHLFHTQTPSNWIVNLWWRLIIRPSSEVLMRSYFSWLTSPQITSGDSSFWVWISFRASPPLAGGIKMSLWCFAGPVSGFRLVKLTANVPNQKSGNFSLPISHLLKLVYRLKNNVHLQVSKNVLFQVFCMSVFYSYTMTL